MINERIEDSFIENSENSLKAESLENFINNTLNEFESGTKSFKILIKNLKSFYLNFPFRSNTKNNKNNHHNEFQPFTSTSINRLCSSISLSSLLQPQQNNKSSFNALLRLNPGKISLAIQLIRLLIYAYRSQQCSVADSSSKSLPAVDSRTITNQQSVVEIITRQIDLIIKTAIESIRIINSTLADCYSGGTTQITSKQQLQNQLPTISLTLISLAELLCCLCFWILSINHSGASSASPSSSPSKTYFRNALDSQTSLSLRRLIPQCISSVSDVLLSVWQLEELEKAQSLFNSLSSILISPLLPDSILKIVKNQIISLFWSFALNNFNVQIRKVQK